MRLPDFDYDFRSGPVTSPEELRGVTRGNCRLAVQVYFHVACGLWLPPEQVLDPTFYRSTGEFVHRGGDFDPATPCVGDVLFAERVLNKDGTAAHKTRADFVSEDDWIVALHSAVVLAQDAGGPRIWHATAFAGRTCAWAWATFVEHYRPVAVKRLLGAV